MVRKRRKKKEQSAEDSWFDSGESGFEQAEKISKRKKNERENKSYQPFRFYVPKGESKEIVILDDVPTFFANEYQIWDSQKRETYHQFQPTGIDPLEEFHKDTVDGLKINRPYYALYLTCVTFDTNSKDHDYYRNLLVVKESQIPKFKEYYNDYETLRGLKLRMVRADEDFAPRIGDPMFVPAHKGKNAQLLYSEEELEDMLWNDPIVKDDGTVVKEEGDDAYPFDYSEIFERPTAEKIVDRFGDRLGLDYPPGSDAANRQAFEEEDDDKEMNAAARETKKKRSRKRSRPKSKIRNRRRRKAEEPEEGIDDVEDIDMMDDDLDSPPWDEE